jgi:hypothetical protein
MENQYVNDKCPNLASYSGTVSEQRDQHRSRPNIPIPGGFHEMECVVYIQGHSVSSVHTFKAGSTVSVSTFLW